MKREHGEALPPPAAGRRQYMNTTFIMKLTLKDKDMTPFVEEALIDKG